MNEPEPVRSLPARRLNPDAEALEVIMEGIKEVVPALVQEMNRVRIAEVQSTERVEMERLKNRHNERTTSAKQSHTEKITVICGVVAVGVLGSVLSFWFGKADIGSAIILSAITGVLGLLAGHQTKVTDVAEKEK